MALPAALITEKNTLLQDSAYIILLQIDFSGQTIRLANNTEDIVWNSQTWNKTYFEIDTIDLTATGELPSISCRIQNIDRSLMVYLDNNSGGQGAVIWFYVVNTNHLSETTPFLEFKFTVVGCTETVDFITFKLGMKNPMLRAFPYWRIMKRYCRYKTFKGPLCQYSGSETSCNRTYKVCDETMNNVSRIGCFPSVGSGDFYGD